ncbi:MAG: amidohydrolase family protein, partial [Gemmatimonadales bacterium]
SVRGPTKLLEFTATEGTWIGVDVAPDGRTLVFDLLGHLYEMPIAGGEARPLTRGRSYNHLARYSPDGRKILFTSDRSGKEEVWLLHRGTDSLEKVSKMDYRAMQASWAPDGRSIYLTSQDLGAKLAGHRVDLLGSRTDLVGNGVFGAPTHFTAHPTEPVVYYAEPSGPIFTAGHRIRRYDLRTGETETYLARGGGAADPLLSPDGKTLAYVHRNNLATELVLHDLASRAERVLVPNLDRDRQESGAGMTFGVYPNYSWHPSGREIFYAQGGKIRAVTVASGAVREIPFRAPVRRVLAETIRFPVTIPSEGRTPVRTVRWAQPTPLGPLYEALGDIHLGQGAQRVAITDGDALESSPAFARSTETIYYVSWTDDSLGAIWSRPARARSAPVRLTRTPAQYGSLTLSPDDKTLAFLRGLGDLNRGRALEDEDEFELVLLGPDRTERRVTVVKWESAYPMAVRRPPGIRFSPEGDKLYYSEILKDTLYLQEIGVDGRAKRTLYAFPHAQRVLLSPDLRWIAYREYLRSYVAPASFAGKTVTLTAFDKRGVSKRVDATADGEDLEWTADGSGLYWTRGAALYEKPLADVLAEKAGARKTDLAFEFEVAVPSSTIALTNARVITMDGTKRVLEGATVIVRGNKIEAVGTGLAVPSGARVFDLAGKTVMPGMIDAHAHYNPDVSTLNVIEQRHAGLLANLAYGTTTLYEVYGNHLKDPLVSDLQVKGAIPGSRLLSVGPPIYGLRYYRTKLYRPILSQQDADEVVGFNKDYGATALKDYVQFTRSARMQMYDAARRLGVNVVAETAVDFQMNWTMLMDGVTGLEHTVGLTPIYDDVLKLWSATAAGNTPTLIVVYNGPQGETKFHQTERLWEDQKLLRFFPRDYLLGFRRTTHYYDDDIYAETMAAQIKRLREAGISIQISGHGQMHGLDKHWEMALLARGGFTPMEVIEASTIASARYLGLERQIGSIEPGKLADLVIMNANPLDDVRNARQIEMVMLNGALYRGQDAARIHPDPAPAPKIYYFRGRTDAMVGIDGPADQAPRP